MRANSASSHRPEARWIDDLAVEQVDTDGDGTLETTLYPITDLLGSVQLLTDDAGTPVERITYDPDGTPHFWSADTTRPSVTRIAWTGDGAMPTGDTVTAQAFAIGLSEAIDPASAANATATLTPDGGDPQSLTLTLAADGRAAYLTGATVAAGTQYTLHLDGLTDTSHNPIWPEDKQLTVTDSNAYEVLDDTTAPKLLAVLDGSDAIYLLFDEPVQPAAGYDLGTAISIVRGGQPVDGAATRVTSQLLKWTPSDPAAYPLGGSYTISALHLADLNANTATSTPTTFTHLNTTGQLLLLAYQAPTDTHPEAQSAYGVTNLFQGRTWHGDLGMYFYRARWYLPEMGEFAERDPLSYRDSVSLTQFLGYSTPNILDPLGLGAQAPSKDQPPVLFPFKEQEEETPDVPVDPWPVPLMPLVGRRMTIGPAPDLEVTETQRELMRELLHGMERLARVDYQDRFVVSFLLDQAEKHQGSSGVSPEAMVVGGALGLHLGLNFQIFYNRSGDYSVGLFGFETLRTPIKLFRGEEIHYEHELQKISGPTGTLGFNAGAALAVNIAVADSSAQNNPNRWTGYFDTVSGSAVIPIGHVPVPVSASYFRSEAFQGAEVGPSTPGFGIAYTRPYFHLFKQWSLDRESVAAIYRIAVHAGRLVF